MSSNNFVDLDFDLILKNLKEFLRQKPEYQDFNFDGSGWAYLLNLLAYNTQYLAFYTNMISNEMYLDTAQLRNNAVSLAKLVGYIPRSKRSARAKIKFELVPYPDNSPETIYIPTTATFASRAASSNSAIYTFNVVNAASLYPDESGRFITELDLVEGTKTVDEYIVDNTDPDQRFVINNPDMDSTTLRVFVKNSKYDNVVTEYKRAEDITDLTSDSKAYYLIEIEDEKFEIQFGDDIISYMPKTGNVVVFEYIISSGVAANDINQFVAEADYYILYPSSSDIRYYRITTVQSSYGGADKESIESIKRSAPVSYETQNRCVTANDYDFILKNNYLDIDSLNVWGGEDNVQPIYGSVFISIKPKNGFILDNAEKEFIKNQILKTKSVITVQPILVDPSYTHIVLDCFVNYDANKTRRNKFEIQNNIYEYILNWAKTSLGKFDKGFIYSSFVAMIDEKIDQSIMNNLVNVQLKKYIYPTLGIKEQQVLEFQNPLSTVNESAAIDQRAILSSFFIYKGKACVLANKSVGSNILSCFNFDNNKLNFMLDVGSIDYTNGIIIINNFVPDSWIGESTYIVITVKPSSNNIVSARNQILICEEGDIKVKVNPIK